MAELRSGKSAYQEDMNIYRKIAEATGDTIEAVCQMQEEERNQLIQVLGIQQERGGTKGGDMEEDNRETSKGGRKRKALQTFLSENPNKKLNRGANEGEEGVSLRNNSRAAARKANLKVSEINKILDSDPETSTDPDQKIEDFDDLDLVGNAPDGKVEVEATVKVPQQVSDNDKDDSVPPQDSVTARSNLLTKCPDLLKFIRKAEDILNGDLPEFNLNKERKPKVRELERHVRTVKSLTSAGLLHSKIEKKSWIKIKVVQSKPKTIHVTKDGTLAGWENEEEEEAGPSTGIKDDQKKLNLQSENKNQFDIEDEDEPIVPTASKFNFKIRGRGKQQQTKKNDFEDEDEEDFKLPSASRKSLYHKIKSKGKKILRGGKADFDFVDGDDDDDEQLSLFDTLKQGKKTPKEKKAVDVETQFMDKSDDDDDEIQFVKEVQSPQKSQVSRRPAIFEDEKTGKVKTDCPICCLSFPQDEVEQHAATCGAQ